MADREEFNEALKQALAAAAPSELEEPLSKISALGMVKQAVEAFLNELNNKDPWVRHNAVEALGRLGLRDERVKKAVPDLIEALADPLLRADIARALGMIGDDKAVPALIECLNDGNREVRGNATEALGHMKDRRSVPALIEKLEDENARVRFSAALSLGRIGDARALPALRKALLEDPDVMVRTYAAASIGVIGDLTKDKSGAPALIKALRDKEIEVVRTAASSLGRLKDEGAVLPLTALLSHENNFVRSDAAWALGVIGDASALPALRARLNDEDDMVRGNVKLAIEKIEGRR
ncbi:MAG: HEAT repeat domain-containing protein [Candidatus Micrarchaeia archaeon]